MAASHANPHPLLTRLTATAVLRNIAALAPARLLFGQSIPSRNSARRRFPPVDFYGNQIMPSGQPGHRHPWPELATVLSGSFHFGIAPYTYRARRGDWLLLRPNALHGECALESCLPYQLFWFVFNQDNLRVHATSYSRSRGYQVLDYANFAPISSELRSALDHFLQHPLQADATVSATLVALAAHTLDHLRRPAPTPASNFPSSHPLVAQVQQIIQQSANRPPSLVTLANHVALSPNYLSSLFHRQTGLTLHQFIDRHRIDLAKDRLTKPAASVKQIAYALGFANPYHFSRVFHRVTGQRPSAYRAAAVKVRTSDR
ncbi:MAG: helix-turn-helix domain-containing protein [Phycisphaeraceae bacterium]|nr:helix-turn-helix domain-containing protein [Phycisphaeraceae bacterium]